MRCLLTLALLAATSLLLGASTTVEVPGSAPNLEFVDVDNDLKAEFAYLWDADGDGSTYVTCTAKDAPFPQCKFNGDLIYPDAADDLNCMIPQPDGTPRCGQSRTMAQGGTIRLLPDVRYIMFGCWDIEAWTADANTPTNVPSVTTINDPRAAHVAARVTNPIPFLADCPLIEFGARMAVFNPGAWQGTIEGGGTDTRSSSEITADATLRGTYLVSDYGRVRDNWEGGGFMPQINLGLEMTTCTTESTCNTIQKGPRWVHPSNPNSIGHGSFGTHSTDLNAATFTSGELCVCDDASTGCAAMTGSTDAVSADLWLSGSGLLQGAIAYVLLPVRGEKSGPMVTAVTLSDDADNFVKGNCTEDGELEVKIGWEKVLQASQGSAHGTTSVQGLPFDVFEGDMDCTETNAACGMFIGDPAYITRGVTFRNMTIMPQDPWNEVGGDCPHTVLTSGVYSATDGAPNVADDGTWGLANAENCDTNWLVRRNNFGYDKFENVVVSNWAHFAIDTGGSISGKFIMEDVIFAHGTGMAISDPAPAVKFRNIEVRDSMFTGNVIGAFGAYLDIDGMTIRNSLFSKIAQISTRHRGGNIRDIEVINSSSDQIFDFQCGAQDVSIDGVRLTGWGGRFTGVTNSVINMNCTTTDATLGIERNSIRNIWLDPPGSANQNRNSVIVTMISDDASGVNDIINNSFTNLWNNDTRSKAVILRMSGNTEDVGMLSMMQDNHWRGLHAGSETEFTCFAAGGGCSGSDNLPEFSHVLGISDAGPGHMTMKNNTTVTTGTAFTMGAAEGQWVFMDEVGATQIELPAVSVGARFCVYSATAQVISLNPAGTESIFLDGADITGGDELDSPGALGDYVCLRSNGTNWYVTDIDGAWVDGGSS